MDVLRIEVVRLMVLMHHNTWAIFAVMVVGVGSFVLATFIRNTTSRNIVLGISIVVLTFFATTGLVVAPMDNWQHQHYSCLLETLEKMEKK